MREDREHGHLSRVQEVSAELQEVAHLPRGLLRVVPEGSQKSLQKVMYGGKPDVDLPFLWALWGEVQAAGQMLLGSQEFEYLRDMFGQRPFPHATMLFYALSSFEDEALSHFITDFKDTFPTGNVNSLIYDGCICLLPADADEADVGVLVTMVSDLSAVNWSVAKI